MRFRDTWIIIAAILLISCNNGSRCYESGDSLMVAVFTGNNSKKIGPFTITGYGKNTVGDTLVHTTDSVLVRKVGLPLSILADSTGFVVSANGRTHTFWVKHTMNLQLISQSCGFAPYYKLTATRHTSLIDSVKIFDPGVNPKSVERYATLGQNITIYLHLTAN
jgi:hypothetical protein